jgi:hypothetical protein
MLKKNLPSIIILIVLIVVSAIYFLFDRNNTLSKESAFACNDLSKVTCINIKNGESSFAIIKKNNQWYYNSKFAVKSSLMSICYKLFSQVEIKSAVPKKKSNAIAEKLKQTGTEITLYETDKIIKHYYLWADTLTRDTYMMMANKEIPYIVTLPSIHGNFTAVFKLNSGSWRDMTIIHYTPDQIANVQVENTADQNQSFELFISSKGKASLINLKSGKAVSFKPEAVEAYLYCYKNIKAVSFIENISEILKKIKKKLPLFKVSVTDHEGNLNTLVIFQKKEGNKADVNFCYMLINDKELVIIKYIEIDPITRELDFFMNIPSNSSK